MYRLLLALTLFAGLAFAQDTYRVGIVGPMAFVQGQHHMFGAEMAAAEINAAGGIQVGDKSYQIELVQVDSNEIQNVADAATAVERAITGQNVDFLMGGFRTEAVFPMTDVAVDYQIPFMIVGAATDELLKGRVDTDYDTYKYLFRLSPLRGTVLARLTINQLAGVIAQVQEVLGTTPKVAIVAEQLQWNEGIVAAVEATIPKIGGEFVGTWRPSATATDVTAELTAVQRAGADIIYTANSGPLGIPFGRDWGRLEIPAVVVGITVEAQKLGWLTATDGYGDGVGTLATYGPVAITPTTLAFYDSFIAEHGDIPIYTAGTYDGLYVLKDALERAGTTDTDALITALEATDFEGTTGRIVFDELHDVTFGPEYVTGLGVQWQDGEYQAFWPNNWHPDPQNNPDLSVTIDGTVPYVIPARILEAWQNR